MSFASQACQFPSVSVHLPPGKIESRAEKLACLLIDAQEFQNYVRLERAVTLDAQVGELNEKIYALQMAYLTSTDEEGNTIDTLHARLEALPIMIEFRQAEKAARELFTAVDAIISEAAGIEFSANGRSVFT